jgi:hypothetical protein
MDMADNTAVLVSDVVFMVGVAERWLDDEQAHDYRAEDGVGLLEELITYAAS